MHVKFNTIRCVRVSLGLEALLQWANRPSNSRTPPPAQRVSCPSPACQAELPISTTCCDASQPLLSQHNRFHGCARTKVREQPSLEFNSNKNVCCLCSNFFTLFIRSTCIMTIGYGHKEWPASLGRAEEQQAEYYIARRKPLWNQCDPHLLSDGNCLLHQSQMSQR